MSSPDDTHRHGHMYERPGPTISLHGKTKPNRSVVGLFPLGGREGRGTPSAPPHGEVTGVFLPSIDCPSRLSHCAPWWVENSIPVCEGSVGVNY